MDSVRVEDARQRVRRIVETPVLELKGRTLNWAVELEVEGRHLVVLEDQPRNMLYTRSAVLGSEGYTDLRVVPKYSRELDLVFGVLEAFGERAEESYRTVVRYSTEGRPPHEFAALFQSDVTATAVAPRCSAAVSRVLVQAARYRRRRHLRSAVEVDQYAAE